MAAGDSLLPENENQHPKTQGYVSACWGQDWQRGGEEEVHTTKANSES